MHMAHMAHDLHMAPWDLFWWQVPMLPAMWMERMAWVEAWHLHLVFGLRLPRGTRVLCKYLGCPDFGQKWHSWSCVEQYQIYETCFALRFHPSTSAKSALDVHSPTYPFSKTKSIWIEPQVGGIDIWALQKLATLHSGIQTTHRPQPKNPRPPQCGSIETPQKEGFIFDLQHRTEQSLPIPKNSSWYLSSSSV